MSTLAGITTHDAVRGVLGVGVEELPDSLFLDVRLGDQLELDIEEWLGDTIATVVSAGTVVSSSATQKKRLTALRLYAQYRGGLLMFSHLHSGTAAEVQDGQNVMKRRAGDLEKLRAELEGQAAKYMNILLEIEDRTAASAPALVGKATPSYDPVTNEST